MRMGSGQRSMMTEWWQVLQFVGVIVLISIWIFTDHSKWPKINAGARREKKK